MIQTISLENLVKLSFLQYSAENAIIQSSEESSEAACSKAIIAGLPHVLGMLVGL